MGSEALQVEDSRSSGRREFIKLATIHFDGQKDPAKIINVSSGGMGIWGLKVQNGSEVEVEWKKGEKISASVVWSIGEAAGLAFKEDLYDDHPLLDLAAKSK